MKVTIALNSPIHFLHTNPNHRLIVKPKAHNPPPQLINLIRKPKPNNRTHLVSKPNNRTHLISEPTFPLPKDTKLNHNTCSDVLRLMDGLSFVVTPDIYASFITECSKKRNPIEAKQLYNHIKRNRRMVRCLSWPSGLLLLNRILMMLVVCGCFEDAHQLFDDMPQRDSISLSIMVSGFVSGGAFDRVLVLFVEMQRCLVCQPRDVVMQVVLVCVLKACVSLGNVSVGKMVHGWLFKMGCGQLVSEGLIRFYGKFRCLEEVNLLFDEQIRLNDHCDASLWTYVIVNNCRGGRFQEVVRMFEKMGKAGGRKNEFVFSSVLKACGKLSDNGSSSYGMQVHAETIKLALDTHDLVTSGLIDMYARCGRLNDARKVFDMIRPCSRSKACWNSTVSGFIRNGLCIEAIKVIYQMKAAGLHPEESLLVKLRVASGSENYEMSTR